MRTLLEKKLWKITDMFRGNMDANEYKNYVLGLITYKHLSEKLENQLDSQYLFKTIVDEIQKGQPIIEDLEIAFRKISDFEDETGSKVFENLFEDVYLQSSKLGKSFADRNMFISRICLSLNELDFDLEDSSESLGEVFESLIATFSSATGRKAGEFYTPKEVCNVLAKIVTKDKEELNSVYDPACGSGSLLLKVAEEVGVDKFYGQELNQTIYNLARMNMIMHDVPFNRFDIKQGDCLEEPQHLGMKFDAIVSHPPFSMRWSSDIAFIDDERFSAYGKLPPRTKADFAFIQHMIYHLDENGAMAVVLPHGVLFRGAAEEIIRKELINNNYLDAVIGLPANLFYGTGIPTCILVFKKCREDDSDVLFIDASKSFGKVKNQNKLRPEDIEKIVTTYTNREEIEKYSHKVTLSEIKENDFNLNIPRYIDTYEPEELLDISEIMEKHAEKSKRLSEVNVKIEEACKDLGIDILKLKL